MLIIDDRFEDHDKVAPLSDAAHRLWMRAACWCKQPERPEHIRASGFVPAAFLPKIAQGAHPLPRLLELAQELVDARGIDVAGAVPHEHGLWEPVDRDSKVIGWLFHDWPRYQQRRPAEPAADQQSAPAADQQRTLSPAQLAARSAGGRARATSKGAAGRFQQSSSSGQQSSAGAHQQSQPAEPAKGHQQPASKAPAAASKALLEPTSKAPASRASDSQTESESDPISEESEGGDLDLVGTREKPPAERPLPRRTPLLARRIFAGEYEPLLEHRSYATALGLDSAGYDDALRDLRDKHGGRPHDEPWLDDKFCSFLEQEAKPKPSQRGAQGPRRPGWQPPDAGITGFEGAEEETDAIGG